MAPFASEKEAACRELIRAQARMLEFYMTLEDAEDVKGRLEDALGPLSSGGVGRSVTINYDLKEKPTPPTRPPVEQQQVQSKDDIKTAWGSVDVSGVGPHDAKTNSEGI